MGTNVPVVGQLMMLQLQLWAVDDASTSIELTLIYMSFSFRDGDIYMSLQSKVHKANDDHNFLN